MLWSTSRSGSSSGESQGESQGESPPDLDSSCDSRYSIWHCGSPSSQTLRGAAPRGVGRRQTGAAGCAAERCRRPGTSARIERNAAVACRRRRPPPPRPPRRSGAPPSRRRGRAPRPPAAPAHLGARCRGGRPPRTPAPRRARPRRGKHARGGGRRGDRRQRRVRRWLGDARGREAEQLALARDADVQQALAVREADAFAHAAVDGGLALVREHEPVPPDVRAQLVFGGGDGGAGASNRRGRSRGGRRGRSRGAARRRRPARASEPTIARSQWIARSQRTTVRSTTAAPSARPAAPLLSGPTIRSARPRPTRRGGAAPCSTSAWARSWGCPSPTRRGSAAW